ncbi:hypothetical protein L7F22_016035 [Adiantum nelumboides]|nr:hypothetical protein [Adiantum nelumboides]
MASRGSHLISWKGPLPKAPTSFPRKLLPLKQAHLLLLLLKHHPRPFSALLQMSWYSWWTGRVGADANQFADVENRQPKVALVVGITGIVGTSLANLLLKPDAPGGPWKVYGVARRAQPKWFANTQIDYVQCDVLDKTDTQTKFAPLKDVTHLFWVVWVSRGSEEINCADNGKMFQNVLDVLLPNAQNLQHIVLQTGGKHYVGMSRSTWSSHGNEPPFKEDMPRLPFPNFYYTLEDILFDTVKRKDVNLTWSIHRPNVIFGFSPCSLMNILGSLAVYACICKHEGLPFLFPGNSTYWEQFGDVSDADLVAEQELWAALDSSAKNQAFNISNGDVFNYKRVWSHLAEQFDIDVPDYSGQPTSLSKAMEGKGPVWDAIVQKHGLVPTKFDEIANWQYVDGLLNTNLLGISSMNKSKEFGFFGFRNTEASVGKWIGKMRQDRLIP